MNRRLAVALCGLLLAGCRTASPRKEEAPVQPEVLAPLTVAPESADFEARVLEKDPEGCTWVESEGAVTVGSNETRSQAEAAAIQEARNLALKKLLGVKVTNRFMSFQSESMRGQDVLVSDITQAIRPGREIDMRVVDKGYRSVAGCRDCRYYVRLRSCIVPEADTADRDFSVEVKVSREVLYEGDSATLEITASKDCYIYLYDTYDVGGGKKRTDLLIPSQYAPEARVRAGKTWVFPDEEAKKLGLMALEAQLPADKPVVSVEEIRVIASKTPLPAKIHDPKIPNPRQSDDSGRSAVLRRLNSSRVEWVEDSAAISIFQKP